MQIGVVGQGFVGGSLTQAFRQNTQIETYDIIKEKSTTNSLVDLVEKCEVLFVCLPTPMTETGQCHTKIVENTLEKINNIGSRTVITKSTVPPGTHEKWAEKYKNLSIVFNPEFLTEKNALEDFLSQEYIILGCSNHNDFETARQVFLRNFPNAEYVRSTYSEAESIKYFTNTFLSTKISFCNEFYQFCKSARIDYDFVSSVAHKDSRLGNSHYKVPGPDEDYGFGGHCFPKDINALIHSLKDNDVDCEILEAVWSKNLKVRNKQEWLSMDGRAFIKQGE